MGGDQVTLYEPLSGLLSASEAEILAAFPRSHPDPILNRLRRLQRQGLVVRDRHGIYKRYIAPKDEEPSQSVKAGNPSPRSRVKERTCPACRKTYTGIRKNFGNGKYCKPCRRHRPQMLFDRTCPSCGVTYTGIVEHFKRKGRLRSTCNPCGIREIEERIRGRKCIAT